jgi:photosystem II stability/assembly factor-like uncharacterized protein
MTSFFRGSKIFSTREGRIMNKYNSSAMLCGLCVMLLSACQPATPAPTATVKPTAAPTEKPEPWVLLQSNQAPPLIQLAGFYDAAYGIVISDDSRVLFTEDGGANWQPSSISSFQLFGLDIVDRNTAWTCGNGTLQVTSDGAKTWQAEADFGAHFPDQCRFLSFLDAQTGWAATSTRLVTTTDGAAGLTDGVLPEGADRIAAISLYEIGNGYLLAQSGDLFFTADNAQTWKAAGTLPLKDIAIADKNPPVAAMRFTDSGHGIIVIPSAGGGSSRVTAFHTSDGGAAWTQETVTDVFGFPVIAHDGKTLTLYTITSKILVYQYSGS